MSQQNELPLDFHNASTSFNITQPMLLSLRQTKPWVMLVSVIGFIYIGISVFFSVVAMFIFSQFNDTGSFVSSSMLVVMNILMGILYFFSSLFLFKFASSIGRLLDGGGATEMEQALSNQKSFWKFVGMLVIIAIILGVLGVVAAIIISIFARFIG
jgi:hypothetical protein